MLDWHLFAQEQKSNSKSKEHSPDNQQYHASVKKDCLDITLYEHPEPTHDVLQSGFNHYWVFLMFASDMEQNSRNAHDPFTHEYVKRDVVVEQGVQNKWSIESSNHDLHSWVFHDFKYVCSHGILAERMVKCGTEKDENQTEPLEDSGEHSHAGVMIGDAADQHQESYECQQSPDSMSHPVQDLFLNKVAWLLHVQFSILEF